ncbi:tripartite tricarboxylate transporter TctB family protein [Microbaculum marinum]|uniref:Tripartite tricarboxylate transporter TctB family protein n=1 Tax=Microbaculum marinum TaxID=1764581 RepID=A0AAW9RZ74_9HYPH
MRDYRDILGGLSLILIGLYAAIYSFVLLRIGSLSNMGPGFAPASMGIILVFLGLGIMVPAFLRAGAWPSGDLRAFLAVSASVATFAILLRPFGLIPAIFGLTFVAYLSDDSMTLLGRLCVAAGLCLGATLIFVVALGVQIPILNWPW